MPICRAIAHTINCSWVTYVMTSQKSWKKSTCSFLKREGSYSSPWVEFIFFFKGSRVCSRNQNLIIHSWCCSRCWWQRSAAANWFDFGEHPLKEISLAKGIKCVKGSWLQGERERPAWWCMPVMPVLGQPRASLSTSFPLPPLSLQLSVLPTECWGRGDWGIPGNG